jgi:hypothetical protein
LNFPPLFAASTAAHTIGASDPDIDEFGIEFGDIVIDADEKAKRAKA